MQFSRITHDFIGNIDVDNLLLNNKTDKNSIAILSPHASYFFSGDVAALSFNSVIDKEFENVFILSTSHTAGYKGSSILNEDYNTPYGDMIINKDIIQELLSNHYAGNPSKWDLFNVIPQFFMNDHTIEILLPLIQKSIKYKNIVPIMIGDSDVNHLKELSLSLEKYFNDENNLFVISSDFSHYPNYEDALFVDDETKELILKKNSKDFIDGIFKYNKSNVVTRMCGWSAYLILLFMIEKRDDIEIKFLKYKNSGEVMDKNRTVGYYSIGFVKK